MKTHRLFFAVVTAIVAGLSGCAFTPQAVIIKPQVDAPVTSLGAGRSVVLNVIDERPKQTLGTKGVGGRGADLTIDGDLTQIVRGAIADGLARQTFRTSSAAESASNQLRVEIRNLDYVTIMGFWAGTLRVDVGLKANCLRGLTRPYEKLYRGEHVESIQVVQTPENNNKYISSAVGEAVSLLLKDPELMRCLAVVPGGSAAAMPTNVPVQEVKVEPASPQMQAAPAQATHPAKFEAPATPPPTASGAPSPVSATIATAKQGSPGQDAFNAARVAKDRSCQATPTPILVAKGAGYESYTVACTSGDALMIRCEFGSCRALQ